MASVPPGVNCTAWLNHPRRSAGRVGRGLTLGGVLSSFTTYVIATDSSDLFVTVQVKAIPLVSVSTVRVSQPTELLISPAGPKLQPTVVSPTCHPFAPSFPVT